MGKIFQVWHELNKIEHLFIFIIACSLCMLLRVTSFQLCPVHLRSLRTQNLIQTMRFTLSTSNLRNDRGGALTTVTQVGLVPAYAGSLHWKDGRLHRALSSIKRSLNRVNGTMHFLLVGCCNQPKGGGGFFVIFLARRRPRVDSARRWH